MEKERTRTARVDLPFGKSKSEEHLGVSRRMEGLYKFNNMYIFR